MRPRSAPAAVAGTGRDGERVAAAEVKNVTSILWKRLDAPGHDACRLLRSSSGWQLNGTAAFIENGATASLSYEVICDAAFATRIARVTGCLGSNEFRVEVRRDGSRWFIDGMEEVEVAGCLDIDLSFTPATNLLAIRRLELGVGHARSVAAAWLAFPKARLTRLEQSYARIDRARYAYSGLGYADTLDVSPSGFVTRYPGLWEAELLQDDPHG